MKETINEVHRSIIQVNGRLKEKVFIQYLREHYGVTESWIRNSFPNSSLYFILNKNITKNKYGVLGKLSSDLAAREITKGEVLQGARTER